MGVIGRVPTPNNSPAIPSSQKQYSSANSGNIIMVEGFGAQPVPAPKYVAANDNGPARRREIIGGMYGVGGILDFIKNQEATEKERGQYIGLTRGEPRGGYEVPEEVRPHLASWLASLDEPRQGDFMQTYTGRKFWPMDPRADEVFVEDIAHSLSLQCRYAGHCKRFYSVAEHSVLMARKLRWEGVDVALWALLHDASEAYLVDVPRPVKPWLEGYKAAEAKVMAAICDRYSLAQEMPAVVHDADNRIIADEVVNLVPMDWHRKHVRPLGVSLKYWSAEKAKEEFLATFDALMDCRARGMS